MTSNEELESRVGALEDRVSRAVQDSLAARHMASAVDRDFSEVNLKLDNLRTGLSALSLQTTERLTGLRDEMNQRLDAMDQRFDGMDQRFDGMDQRFDGMDQRFDGIDRNFDQVDQNFAAVHGKFGQLSGGMQHITDLLTVLVDRDGGA